MPKFKARTDANHKEHIHTLKKAGYSVVDLSRVGGGCPDLLVGKNGHCWLVEAKTESGKISPKQDEFANNWRGGPIYVSRDPSWALVALEIKLKTL